MSDQFSNYKTELLDSIPVVKSMDVEIAHLDEFKCGLQAPLSTHINYEGTAFGGSLNTLCILSCYLLTHHLLKYHQVQFSSLVIQNSQIEYLQPVNSDFIAEAHFFSGKESQFIKQLASKGIGRIELSSQIFCNNEQQPKVNFFGRFVATL